MGIAREFTRATLLKRKEQAKRNAEAEAAEEKRLGAMRAGAVGHRYRPPARRKMIHVGSPENKMIEPVQEDKDELPDVTLADLPWASPQAFNRAERAGLTPADFEGRDYSGKAGFTAGDVAAIAKGKQGE